MNKYKEIIMYIIFGVLTTAVSWGSYTIFIHISISVFFANLLSWILAVAFAYITNKLWVFNSKSWAPKLLVKEIGSFVASRALTGAIEIVLVPLMAKWGFDNIFYNMLKGANISAKILFTSGIYSKISVAVLVVILNYVFSKLVIFKKPKKQD